MGCVKDLTILVEPMGNQPGRGRFVFSGRYSVFDWGEMPDHIPDKGRAICIVTAHFFERLEGEGVRTHYIGLVGDGAAKRLDELDSPSDVKESEPGQALERTLFDVSAKLESSDRYGT